MSHCTPEHSGYRDTTTGGVDATDALAAGAKVTMHGQGGSGGSYSATHAGAKPTGEWPVRIKQILTENRLTYDERIQMLSDEINAALAASVHYWQGVATQEWHKGFAASHDEHQQQLADEKKLRHQESSRLVDFWSNKLAAERLENHARTSPTQSAILVIDDLKRQLAAEQENNEVRDHQAEAWIRVCTLCVELGADHMLPGKVAMEQIEYFIKQLVAERDSYIKQRDDWIKEIQQLQEQLAAERDNVEQWKTQYGLKSEMFLRVSEELAAERENAEKWHGAFKQAFETGQQIEKERDEAKLQRKAAETAVFAARRLDEQQIAEAVAAERERLEAKWKESMVDVTTALQNYEKQLAAEQRRANDSIEENVRLMNRLAAERERADKNADVIEATALELHDERERTQTLVDALEWYAGGKLMTKVAKDALAKVKEGK
jgi:hypothetical protein